MAEKAAGMAWVLVPPTHPSQKTQAKWQNPAREEILMSAKLSGWVIRATRSKACFGPGKVSLCFWFKARDIINHNEQQAETLALDCSYAAAGPKPFMNDQFQGCVSTIFANSLLYMEIELACILLQSKYHSRTEYMKRNHGQRCFARLVSLSVFFLMLWDSRSPN